MKPLRIGVLALQGAFAKHLAMLQHMGVQGIEVRTPLELGLCAGLIIPGGESTTIFKQLYFIELFEALKKFAATRPVFGTCAGLILMSSKIYGDKVMQPFGLLDVLVERNAFGRQVESFCSKVKVSLAKGRPVSFPGTFIRAPRILEVGAHVKVLATYEEEPVLVEEGLHLGASFHPELSSPYNSLIHEFFISKVKACQSARPR